VVVLAALFVAVGLLGGMVAGLALSALAIGFVVWRVRSSGAGFGAIGLARPESIPATFAMGLLAWFGVALVAGATNLALQSFGFQADLEALRFVHGNRIAYFKLLGVAWATAAFGEEIIFRGYLFHRLEVGFGGGRRATAGALILQALIFGLGHAYQGAAGMLLTGVIGLCLAGAMLRFKRNLWVVIIAHGVVDTLGLTLLYYRGPP
jgi:membrane protease YdiL (CAAX protease family)